MTARILSGIGNTIKTIGANMKQLTDFGLIGSAMASGLKPVYRITSSETLSDGTVTDRWLIDTIPDWVLVSDVGKSTPSIGFDLDYVRTLVQYKKEELVRNPDTMPEVTGILMDESPKNTLYRNMVDIIFTNPPLETKDGTRKMVGEDFLLLGYPIQLTIGFIDVDGNFRKHPHEPPISTYGTIPPDFTGILGALTQETFGQGDFFQGTFIGFAYLLSRFRPQDPFPISQGEHVTRTLARILRWLAIKSSNYTRTSTTVGRSATTGDATIAIPILRAMGVVGPNDTRILSVDEIKKNIVMVDIPRNSSITCTNIPRGNGSITCPTDMSYAEIIEGIEQLTNTEIFFNEHGRLTVSGKPKVRERVSKSYDRIRVHDAIIGNNVIHHQTTVDLSQIVNRVIIHKKFSGISAESPVMSIVKPNADMLIEKDEVAKYYAHNEEFDSKHVYHYGDLDFDESESINMRNKMVDYFRYYGLRGTIFMVGNPKIRVNDIIRVSDIRSFGIKGMNNPQSVMNVSKEVQYIIEKVDRDTGDAFEYDPLIEKSLRIKTGIDHFHVWKVVHYIGADGFRTKVFYAKEDNSYIPGSDLLTQHTRYRKRGIAGDTK